MMRCEDVGSEVQKVSVLYKIVDLSKSPSMELLSPVSCQRELCQ